MRRIVIIIAASLLFSTIALWWTHSGARSSPVRAAAAQQQVPPPRQDIAEESQPLALPQGKKAFYDPLIITPCNLVPISEQDVSSQVDGVFDAIDVELGQQVEKGALLGRLDARQLRAQVEALEIRAVSTAAERIAKAQFDEADSKVRYALKANEAGLTTVPDLEYKTYLFQRERFAQEIKKAREERESAQKELDKAKVVLGLYDIRSALAGEIVKIYKRNGEAVKQAEPLFRVANCTALRIEGLCKVQQANLIRVGMRALVEPALRGEQMTELVGHTGAITGIAVSADGRLLASASEDQRVLLWAWPGGARVGTLPHPAEVTAICMRQQNTILTGCADGQVRLWHLHGGTVPAPAMFSQAHEGPIRAIALSPDGAACATGGDDKRIGIWDVETGKHRMWLQPEEGMSAHQGAVTSVRFAAGGRLISAGRDNMLRVWTLAEGGRLLGVHPGRTGDVPNLGISPDGRQVLLDMGEELRMVDRETGTHLASLQNQIQGRFQGFAEFSPTGRLLLTAASNSRLQLWRAPVTTEQAHLFRQGYAGGFHRSSLFALRAIGAQSSFAALTGVMMASGTTPAPTLWQLSAEEVRHFFVPGAATVQCGVFAPDESVVFTGGTDKIVRVWAVPPPDLWSAPLEGRITYVSSQVERGTDMVRIRAEVDNPRDPERQLRAGLFAVMRLFPETVALR
jgi:WD40 repeat protein